MSQFWGPLHPSVPAFVPSPHFVVPAFCQQVVTDVRTFADNTPLDWGSFMSEETKQYKELLDTAAEGLGQAADFVESNLPELETDITLIIP